MRPEALVIMLDGPAWLEEMLRNEHFKVVRRYERGVALPAFVLGGANAILEARKVPNLHGVILWNATGVKSTDLAVPLLLINSEPIDAHDVTRVSGGDERLAAKLAARFISVHA
ncbi:MAG: hypothetical protein DMF59_01705 [Acidobacteria bacterium]|nr:MAG: hypothetical protein DMF59_01705 [Acidobacteriota bacterium]